MLAMSMCVSNDCTCFNVHFILFQGVWPCFSCSLDEKRRLSQLSPPVCPWFDPASEPHCLVQVTGKLVISGLLFSIGINSFVKFRLRSRQRILRHYVL